MRVAHRLAHGHAAKIAEIDLLALVFHHRRAGGVDGGLPQQLLGKIHHAEVIRVGLIKLQHREFGIVVRRDPLIAEIAVDLVDALQAAHHQALQIQFRRDPQIQIDVERVVMRPERARRRAAVKRLEHGRLHFQKAVRLQVAAAAKRRSSSG